MLYVTFCNSIFFHSHIVSPTPSWNLWKCQIIAPLEFKQRPDFLFPAKCHYHRSEPKDKTVGNYLFVFIVQIFYWEYFWLYTKRKFFEWLERLWIWKHKKSMFILCASKTIYWSRSVGMLFVEMLRVCRREHFQITFCTWPMN